jgi:cytochrome oxidase Cu insertion factor (SCO1/SenC/PrrC family)
MKKLLVLLVLVTATAGVFAATVGASATTTTQNTTFPLDILVSIPCANGGAGDIVELTGPLHDLFHITSDGNGGFHVKQHDQPQDVKGIGLTGTQYSATGVTQEEFNVTAGQTDTFINNFRIIGQGPGNNFLVHEVEHITVNANGDVSVTFDNFSIDCK